MRTWVCLLFLLLGTSAVVRCQSGERDALKWYRRSYFNPLLSLSEEEAIETIPVPDVEVPPSPVDEEFDASANNADEEDEATDGVQNISTSVVQPTSEKPTKPGKFSY